MFATTEGTLVFGVNGANHETYVGVQHGSDDDMKDIIFQIQTIAGCMVRNIVKSNFVTNGGTIENGSTPVESGSEVEKGTTLTLTAEPKTGYVFDKWSDGRTTATISVVATGDPQGFVAFFKAQGA